MAICGRISGTKSRDPDSHNSGQADLSRLEPFHQFYVHTGTTRVQRDGCTATWVILTNDNSPHVGENSGAQSRWVSRNGSVTCAWKLAIARRRRRLKSRYHDWCRNGGSRCPAVTGRVGKQNGRARPKWPRWPDVADSDNSRSTRRRGQRQGPSRFTVDLRMPERRKWTRH